MQHSALNYCLVSERTLKLAWQIPGLVLVISSDVIAIVHSCGFAVNPAAAAHLVVQLL